MNIEHENNRLTGSVSAALALVGVALAGGVAILLCARHFSDAWKQVDELGFDASDEQAVTVLGPIEKAETAWVDWCASGHARLNDDYAIRFEPAPGARGTEVHLSGGGSKGRTKDELRRFKQFLETGEVAASDGPDLSRAAQPRARAERPVTGTAEVL